MRLADRTTFELADFARTPRATVLLPVGSVEPHGPHLPLGTDTLLSDESCARAVARLAELGIPALVAPSVPYGVTDFATGFAGAIGVPAEVLTAFLRAVVGRYLADGVSHVCLVNHHLEPAHDRAVRAAIEGLPRGVASVACPLTRAWARTLSDEFKRGDCHAGRYETSLVLAARTASTGASVRPEHTALPAVGVSLADEIRAGRDRFLAMGMDRAYTGSPALATAAEGDDLYDRLVAMIASEVEAGLRIRSTEDETLDATRVAPR